jgi:tRNA(Ile)-lysidine synthetase-like protein
VDLKAQVSQTIDRYELLPVGDTVVVGVSGGVDSLCLLALLCELAPAYGVTLHVGHLNHLLRPEAAGEAITVRSLCEHWSLPCSVGALDVRSLASTEKLTLEEAARLGRYRYLGGLARQVGATSVAVGHHADDQAETVVMHLLRGAGLAGLRGMRPLALLDEGQSDRDQEAPGASHRIRLIRPLLSITRAQLEAYASERGFAPAIDALNNDRRYLRNRVRHELLPVLQTYNPQIRASLCRTAEALAGDFELLQSAVEEAWDRTVRQSDSARVVFHRRRLWAETQASDTTGRAIPPGLHKRVVVEAGGRRGRDRAQRERGRAGRDARRSGAHHGLRRCRAGSRDCSLDRGQSASDPVRVDADRARRPNAAR